MKTEFKQKEVMESIQKLFAMVDEKEGQKIKPFYHHTEWSGWRFYLKAIRYRDWNSIKGHIKSTYLTNNPKG